MNKLALCTFAAAWSVSACFPPPAPVGHRILPSDVDAHGSWTFDTPRPRVVSALKGALVALGYRIEWEDAERGLVRTDRKHMFAKRRVRAEREVSSREIVGHVTVDTYRSQYFVSVRDAGAGKVVVRAEPKLFFNEVDLSNGPEWNKPAQIEVWQQLKQEIDKLL